MSWSYDRINSYRHGRQKGGGVVSKTGRLGPAPDDHSGSDGHSNCKWSGPAPPAGNRDQSEAAAGKVHPAIANRIQAKVDDMNESTRTTGPTGSGTPAITVKITPVLDSAAPVTTTHGAL